ncbi:MAG: leucine-rich repeat domain-containing protein, partial [Clostridia bacterium]|nr:leucine-rich repeat domain-containing protein [Clostridia bacterium]
MKNSKMKKSLSLILSLIMILSTLSVLTVTSFAETTSDGIVYDASGGTTVVTGYTGTKTSVTIPSQLGGKTVTAINSFVSDKITSVTLPDTITSIGDGAFDGCSKLKTVKLNQGLQTIGGYAFRGTIIESISIPKSVTALASNTDYTSYVNRSAFGGATNLKDVVFENGITAIPANA